MCTHLEPNVMFLLLTNFRLASHMIMWMVLRKNLEKISCPVIRQASFKGVAGCLLSRREQSSLRIVCQLKCANHVSLVGMKL